MKSWPRPGIALTLVTISALLIVTLSLPLSLLAAPKAALGTPNYLPIVLNGSSITPTPTSTATTTATSTPTASPTATVTPTPTSTPITSTIPITVGPFIGSEQLVFSPKTATIHVGDTVHWIWGSTGHTVTSGSPAPNADNHFCSPNNSNCSVANTSSVGATFDHQFLAPGTYPYFCQIHWSFGMTGTITVLP